MPSNRIIQSLWIGDKLSNLERLCILSHLKNGHEFHLYTYSNVKDLPIGTVSKDANEIISESHIFMDSSNSVASFSDLFRYKLLFDKGGWWVDMDIICLKYYDFDDEYCFATENGSMVDHKIGVNNCVIKSPAKAEYLKEILEIVYAELKVKNNIKWGRFGPELITQILKTYDSKEYIKSVGTFCPINWYELDSIFDDCNYTPDENVYAIHLWGHLWNSKKFDKNGNFHINSIYEKLKRKYRDQVEN
ncbi:glycosyltransferase [Sphingobacterium multivorum]|uniref:glycosyltransferase n=1 Tax=Sphingobacterium multivorum TaxID=28454 RepID=UPI0028B16876|nr:glycosyltransferase [Sphingobacterium multivorum]